MIDAQPIRQKQRIIEKEITPNIGNDIMGLSVLFPIPGLDKSYKFGPDAGARNAPNVSRLLAPFVRITWRARLGHSATHIPRYSSHMSSLSVLRSEWDSRRSVAFPYIDRSAARTQYHHKHTDKSTMKLSRAAA